MSTKWLWLMMCGAWPLVSCSAVKVEVNGEEMTLNEALGGMEGGGQTHAFTLDANTSVAQTLVNMPLSTALVTTRELGYECDSNGAVMMNPPIARLTVTEAQRVSFVLEQQERALGWIIVRDDGTYQCGERRSDGANQVFDPGVYHVHAAWSAGNIDSMKAMARQPERPVLVFSLKTYGIDEASEYIVIDERTPNPYYTNGAAYRGGFVQASELGFGKECEDKGSISAQPVMEISVVQEQPRLEVVGDGDVTWAIVSEQGQKQCGVPMITTPGRYTLHAMTSSDAIMGDAYHMYSPILWDQSAKLTLTGEVPTLRVDRFSKPLVVKGITRPEKMTSTTRCQVDEAKVGFEPDFFLEFERPLSKTRVMIVPDAKGPQELVIEDITTKPLLMREQRTCSRALEGERFDRRRYSLDTADGRYAGFVAHPGSPRDFAVILWSEDQKVDPWLTVQEIPEKTDTLDERVFTRYFPLFFEAEPTPSEAWARVPERLHVYTMERTGGVDPAQPVLLADVLDRRKGGLPGKVRILTREGKDLVVNGYTLTTDHPDTWN